MAKQQTATATATAKSESRQRVLIPPPLIFCFPWCARRPVSACRRRLIRSGGQERRPGLGETRDLIIRTCGQDRQVKAANPPNSRPQVALFVTTATAHHLMDSRGRK
jgi:hypothetical protein